MKRLCICLLAFLIVCSPVTAYGLSVVPGGNVVGLELRCGTVTVAAVEEKSPAEAAGIREGDRILSIDDRPIRDAADVKRALERSHGSVRMTLSRGREQWSVRLLPDITPAGPKVGLYLKQGITGIGTVTFYDPATGSFGALGHGVNTPEGALAQLTEGKVYEAGVRSVRRGKAGDPGQLLGAITDRTPVGFLEKNTPCGIFGHLESAPAGAPMEICPHDRVKPGKALIRSNIEGNTVREYSVEILRIYPGGRENGRNMLLRVTDPALLSATGGIVQGMSGSPIIQDGKLIGAVTHVLVNDPTTGYGIFIENMLDAAA